MDKEILLFEFSHESQNFIIRSIQVEGEHWYVANDICKALTIKNPHDAVLRVHEDDLGKTEVIDSMGRKQHSNIVNESDLYALIFQSNKPIAKQFKRWVTKEVLPQIRKTGNYLGSGVTFKFHRRVTLNANKTKSGYFSVIHMMSYLVIARLESVGYVLPDHAKDGKELRPDTSLGLCFARYLREYHPQEKDNFLTYEHEFESGIVVNARQYQNRLFPLFSDYIDHVWLTEKAERYFKKRDPKALDYLPKLLPKKAG